MEKARRVGLLCAALAGVVAGCGLVRPASLDIPPGHRVVLGRVDLSALDVGEAALEIVKEDATFTHALWVGLGQEDFAIALPAGRYRIVRVRAVKDRERFPNNPVSDLRLGFQAGPEPATYIGTLRLARDFREEVRVTVADEYERTVATLRARYADLPAAVVRRLLTPA